MRIDDAQDLARSLAPVAALRRAQAPLRVLAAVLIGAAFVWHGRHLAFWLWLAAYAATQAFEIWALWPFREGATAPTARRTWTALGGIALLAACVASVSLFLWRLPGSLGPAAATLLLCQGALNVLSTSRGCRPAFAAGALPYGVAAAILPFSWGTRGAEAMQPAFLLAVLAFVATLLIIWRDGERLTRRERQTLADLEARRREAEASVGARAAFTAAVSHELRTPLSAILAASSALEVQAHTPQTRENAAMIGEASRMMRRILDDLLDLSKLEAGRMRVEAADFDLLGLFDETVRLWAPQAAGKGLGLALTVQGRETLPTHVRGDQLRLRQILNNLVSNAVKFTDRGGIWLELAATRETSDRWRLRIGVSDTGPGLDAQALERLFKPFEQASATVSRTHGGTGLGLAISRELARAMGGDLTAGRRDDESGARFVLELPLAAAAEAGTIEPGAAPASAHGRDPRVVVVDDHPLGRQALTVLLGLRGCEVRTCAHAEAALAVLEEAAFDLVLCDLNMEGLDGRGMTRRLRAGSGPNRNTPVLAVTGDTAPDALAACLDAGMDGLIPKPLEPRALYAAVDAALSAACATPSAAASRDESAASSFSSHSQTINTLQPAISSAA